MKKLLLMLIIATGAFDTAYAVNTNSSDSTVTGVIDNAQSMTLPDFSAIYDKVGKSVVNVSILQNVSQSKYSRYGVVEQKQRGLGSGFIISRDGYILTNAHVIDKADSVTVRLNDKREFVAKIIGSDAITDVAVLKINANNLTPVRIGNPDRMKAGNWVAAIGSPFGLENTITHGIVSALSRNLSDENAVPFIQTDVPINPGNSGGPLINLRGEVIGINSQIYSRSGGYMGISFAIPIDYAMRVAEQIKQTGRAVRGKLGVTIQPVTADIAPSFGLGSPRGVLINGIEENSPASKAGLLVGDIILAINGQKITDGLSLSGLISNLGPNQTIRLEVWRNNHAIELTGVTGSATKLATNNTPKTTTTAPNVGMVPRLGIGAVALTPSQIRQLGLRINGGLVIRKASDVAEYYGLRVGDVILGVGNTPITSLEQLNQLVANAKQGQSIALKVLRINNNVAITMFIAVPILN